MNEIVKSRGRVMQKVIAAICLFCLLLPFAAVTANAQGVSITASSCTVERGATAAVTFNLQGNPGMFSLVLKVDYDASALTLNAVTNGTVFPSPMIGPLDAKPVAYSGYNSELYNLTTNGTVATITFTVKQAAAFGTYPITVTQATGYNDEYQSFEIAAVNGGISVVECVHADKEWRTTVAAKCEEAGTETLTCKKCAQTFGTRALNPTGHIYTQVRNRIAATKTAEGYTGDTYCNECNKKISQGKTIAKLDENTPVVTPPETPAGNPEMTAGKDLVFNKNSSSPLVFVSDAEFSEFIRVEIDGTVLDKDDYTAESGSTIITVNADCLNRLGNGEHTVSIVSTTGTASAQFTVHNEAAAPVVTPDATDIATPSETHADDEETQSSALPIIVAIIVLLIGGVAAFFVIRRRRW